MKKIYRVSIITMIQAGLFSVLCVSAASAAAVEEFPKIAPHIQFSLGGSIWDDSDTPRPSFISPTGLSRSGTKNAIEYLDVDASPYVAGRLEAFPFPNRFFGEVEYNGDDDWFGEIRHAYKDLFIFRDISRRGIHNLNNISILNNLPGYELYLPAVSQRDAGAEYELTTDMHQFWMRLKFPDFPFHVYGTGEIIQRSGNRQQRFLGGNVFFVTPTRETQSRDIDTTSREFSIIANTHLRWFEVEYAHVWQDFSADADSSMPYAYSEYIYPAYGTRAAGTFIHNQIPEIEGRKDILRLHSNLTGQVVASATFADINRINNTSSVEADRFLSYGEISWTPMATLTMGAKMRHQDDDTEAPAFKPTDYRDVFTGSLLPIAVVHPGVEATTDTFSGFVRYSPMAKITLKGQYTKQLRDLKEESAEEWHEPSEKDSDTVELGLGWRALSSLKVNAKSILKNTSIDPGAAAVINYEPERERTYKVDATWTATPKTTVYMSGSLREAEADNWQQLTDMGEPVVNDAGNRANRYDSLAQQYLINVSQVLTSRFSLAASYAYMALEARRDLGLDYYPPDQDSIDTGYSHKLDSHHVSLSGLLQATDKLNLQALVEYTTGRGDYMLTDPRTTNGFSVGSISRTETQEFGTRLEGEYDFGGGWKGGVIVRYVDFVDSSFDNPADGEAVGGLVKMTKTY